MIRTRSNICIGLIASAYMLIAIFGMSMVIMPSEHGDMMGGGCPLMRDVGSLCQTGMLDHIVHWNMLFATTLTAVVLFSIARASFYVPASALAASPPHERYRRYVKEHPHIRLFQNIVAVFSDGIIQPKIFA